MANWILKAVVQKAISFLPAKEKVNFFFQKYVTRGVDLSDEHFGYKLDAARDHLRYYRKYGSVPMQEATVLELGTGWYPIVPLLFFLSGFGRTVSIDIRKWTSKERQLVGIRKVLDYLDRGSLTAYTDTIFPARVEILRRIAGNPDAYTETQINALIQLDTRIMDATHLEFADDTFDFICSNNTFEHIYEPVLREILKEFKRVLNPQGIMSHFVDLSDHFAHLDGSINIYNFLRFSELQWKLIDNDIQPQNRLRWPDYLAIYDELSIPVRETDYRPGALDHLAEIELAERFQRYSPGDLAISHGYLVS